MGLSPHNVCAWMYVNIYTYKYTHICIYIWSVCGIYECVYICMLLSYKENTFQNCIYSNVILAFWKNLKSISLKYLFRLLFGDLVFLFFALFQIGVISKNHYYFLEKIQPLSLFILPQENSFQAKLCQLFTDIIKVTSLLT